MPAGTRGIPMVKADGYGLGMLDGVRALAPLGPWAWGVATVQEGRTLREAGVAERIVVFSPTAPREIPPAVQAGLTLAVSSLEALHALRRVGGPETTFQIEIDTGMGRAGFPWTEVGTWAPVVQSVAEDLRWTGCFTHLHSADQPSTESVRVQRERFDTALRTLSPPACGDDFILHVANSAAALRTPDLAHLGPGTAVRPGIFLWGGEAGVDLPNPLPVAAVRARVGLVREAAAGATLGYGATHVAGARERWATVGLGYGDGLPRALSNRGHALIRGTPVPIIGRISMDVCVVDVTGLDDVTAGDVVTFLGQDGDALITPDQIARTADTIGYEILTGLTGRLPRIWTHDAP